MSDIAKGNIYIIICIQNPKIYYIGSTFNLLTQRWTMHKQHYRDKGYRATSICKYFDEYGVNNFTIKLLKSYDVVRTHSKDFKHLRVYEQLWINKLKGCCNKVNPLNLLPKQQRKFYREDNRDKIREFMKEYREKNKEKISERKKEKYKENKTEINVRKKEYNKKNKEKINERQKEYNKQNKEKIRERKKQKITCECGLETTRDHQARHRTTQRHIRLMNEK